MTDDDLDRIETHARGGLPQGDGEHYVGLLVTEVRRLRAGIRAHRDTCTPDDPTCGFAHEYGKCGESDGRLWTLVDRETAGAPPAHAVQ